MESEKSLIKTNNNIFSKVFKSIKNIFYNFKNKEYSKVEQNFEPPKNTALKDLDVLKNVIDGKVEIKDLDVDVEKRLIALCNNRIEEINKKITAKDLEIAKLKKQIYEL